MVKKLFCLNVFKKRHLPSAQCENNVRFCADVLHSRRPSADLSSEDAVENLNSVFFPLKINAVEISQKRQKQASIVHFLTQLGQNNIRLLVGFIAKQELFHICQLSWQILLSLKNQKISWMQKGIFCISVLHQKIDLLQIMTNL